MSVWTELRQRLAAIMSGTRLDREHQEEVQFHLEMQARKYEQEGVASRLR